MPHDDIAVYIWWICSCAWPACSTAAHLVLKVGVCHGLASHGQADAQGVCAVLVHRTPHGFEVACGKHSSGPPSSDHDEAFDCTWFAEEQVQDCLASRLAAICEFLCVAFHPIAALV